MQKIFYTLETFGDMTDQNLKPHDQQLANYRGRVRGLLAVWQEMRRSRNRLWLSTCPTSGWGRTTTLTLLSEMVAQNARVPGLRNPQPMGRGFPETSKNLTSMGRARTRILAIIHVVLTPPLKDSPNTWLQCLCRYRSDLPAISPPTEPALPLVLRALTWTRPHLDPSLETVMGPELGYQALGLASNTD